MIPYTLKIRRHSDNGPLYLEGTVAAASLPINIDLCGYVPLAGLLPWTARLNYRVRLRAFSRRRGGPLQDVEFYGDEPLTKEQVRRLNRLDLPARSKKS